MAGFRVQKLTAAAVVIDDLGITLTGAISAIVDITDHAPENLARSADLLAAITADNILIVDPRDDTNATILTKAESTAAVNRSNDTHFGISGGRFGAVDDPTITPGADFIIQYNSTGDAAEYIDPADFMSDQSASIGAIVGAMGQDGTDTTFSYNASSFPLIAGQNETNYDASTNNGTFAGTATAGAYVIGDVITMSDGSTVTVDVVSTGDVTDFTVTTSSGANTTAGVPLTQASVLPANGQTGFTITPEQNNISQGTLQWDVDDSFLRNTGDILDSGTLQIASGAALDLPTGSTITIAGDVTEASIQTPGGGFTNNDDLINKEYVDSIAGGFDYKESVRVATTPTDAISGTIAAQDETNYDGAGNNGTFVGGGSYVALDTITMSDGTVITVDLVSVGVITEFTVTTAGTNNVAGTVLTQSSTSGGGSAFTMTTGTANISGIYATSPSNGQFTGVDLSVGTGVTIDGLNFTGVSSTGLIIGDRVLIKDQADATQNGIYFIDAGSIAASVILTRSADMDGTPASEVSGGNTTYVEDTTAINGATENSNSRWSVIGDGILTLNTDDIDWSQTGSGSISTAGIGLSAAGATIDLDVDDLTTATAVASDVIAFHDADGSAQPSGSQTRKSTFQSVFNELDVPNGITANGILVRTGEDTYASRSIAVNGGGPLDGLAVTNGDGVAANPTVGLDIQNMTLRAAVDGVNDRVAVWDSSLNTNVYYSVNDIAGAASASNSFETWTAAGNSTGDASIVADSATDVVTVTGGIGINVDLTAASDIISWSFSRAGMADTAVLGADTIPFFDASNANEPEYRSFTDIISDLSIATNVSASTNEDLLGINVTGTTEIGLDILGLTNPAENMAATDEFAVHNKSEGTAGANRKMTGQEMADGTATILGIETLTFDTFPAIVTPGEDQTLLAYTDAGRSKTLSVESHTFQWADNKVKDNDWIKIGSAGDADSGWVMPLDATIVGVTAHTEDTGGGNTYAIDLYIDAVDSGPVAILTGGADVADTDPTLNIDVDAGEKIRLRADRTAGAGDMQDTTVALLIKWRS